MSVFKRDGSPFWNYQFEIAGRRFRGPTEIPLTGTKREAKIWTEAFKVEKRKELAETAEQSPAPSADPKSLDQVFDAFWLAIGQHRKDNIAVKASLASMIQFFGKSRLITSITNDDIPNLVAWRAAQPSKNSGKGKRKLVKPATVNRSTIDILRRVFTFAGIPALKWGKERLEEPDECVRELRADEFQKFDTGLDENYDDFQDLFRFSLLVGIRQNESLLEWPHVDLSVTPARIARKGKRNKLVYRTLSPEADKIIRRQQGLHPTHVFTYVAQRTRDFTVHGKRHVRVAGQRYPITKTGVKTMMRRLKSKIGISDYRWHDNRHTFATNLLRNTRDLKLVQQALGHSLITTTARYAHVLDDEVQAGVAATEQTVPWGAKRGAA